MSDVFPVGDLRQINPSYQQLSVSFKRPMTHRKSIFRQFSGPGRSTDVGCGKGGEEGGTQDRDPSVTFAIEA